MVGNDDDDDNLKESALGQLVSDLSDTITVTQKKLKAATNHWLLNWPLAQKNTSKMPHKKKRVVQTAPKPKVAKSVSISRKTLRSRKEPGRKKHPRTRYLITIVRKMFDIFRNCFFLCKIYVQTVCIYGFSATKQVGELDTCISKQQLRLDAMMIP